MNGDTMTELKTSDLYSLEEYARIRPDFRRKVMDHKRHRKLALGGNAALYFEDALTMQYQVQEMLRAERIFEEAGIQEELDAFNPLIPDGTNWKATFMLEYPDVEERREALAKLIGIEDKVWVRVAGHDKVYAIADEDLERDTEEKTSSVHFLRFELSPEMIGSLRHDHAPVTAGIDHPGCQVEVSPLPEELRESLLGDLAD